MPYGFEALDKYYLEYLSILRIFTLERNDHSTDVQCKMGSHFSHDR